MHLCIPLAHSHIICYTVLGDFMEYPNRKLPRLHNYDYATPGAYFITICTHNKQCIFGSIHQDGSCDAHLQYSPIGAIAKHHLLALESHYANVKLDNWVIMPNHIHLLIRVTEAQNPLSTIRYDIPNIIGKYKAAVTRSARNALASDKLWQSSFYDHIIRNDEDYQNVWLYISGNPSKWVEDCFYI